MNERFYFGIIISVVVIVYEIVDRYLFETKIRHKKSKDYTDLYRKHNTIMIVLFIAYLSDQIYDYFL